MGRRSRGPARRLKLPRRARLPPISACSWPPSRLASRMRVAPAPISIPADASSRTWLGETNGHGVPSSQSPPRVRPSRREMTKKVPVKTWRQLGRLPRVRADQPLVDGYADQAAPAARHRVDQRPDLLCHPSQPEPVQHLLGEWLRLRPAGSGPRECRHRVTSGTSGRGPGRAGPRARSGRQPAGRGPGAVIVRPPRAQAAADHRGQRPGQDDQVEPDDEYSGGESSKRARSKIVHVSREPVSVCAYPVSGPAGIRLRSVYLSPGEPVGEEGASGGRGPTSDIWPRSTLVSWGSSSRWVTRSHRPSGLALGHGPAGVMVVVGGQRAHLHDRRDLSRPGHPGLPEQGRGRCAAGPRPSGRVAAAPPR